MKELVLAYFEAFNKGRTEDMIELLDPDIEHDINQGKTQKGVESFRAFLKHMNDCYKEELKDIVIMENDDKTRVAAEFMVHGTYLKTDGSLPVARSQKYTIRAGSFFKINNKKIIRITTYYNLSNWIEMVKL